ncbi:MAG: tripartite tricarboxylate transporter TctB family protein [Hyphomicrobiales bacterium]|nr:tripartite tricarboxylate transporter TctB family protein [Hyphomicrobiales bacterium]MCP5002212.1 tripartite tricarboxylate transporter TctB family protein [Hyphomicrobiales bacterium]
MLLSKDRIGGMLLLIFCVTYGFLSQNIILLPIQAKAAFTARTMPEVLMVLGIGLSLLVIIFPGSQERPQLAGFKWGTAALFLVLMSAYGLTIRPFGFLLSTSVFLMAGFAMLGERSAVKLLLVSVPLVLGFWVLMTQGLDVFIEPLPWFLKG